MALGFQNSPVNWNIDYSGNQVGQHYGNALGNLGALTGNAIMNFAKQDAEKKKEKEKKDQTYKMLRQFGVSEELAKSTASSDRVNELQNFMQIDAQMNAIAQRAQEAEARAKRAEAQARAFMEAIKRSQVQQPIPTPRMGPIDDFAPTSTPTGKADPVKFMEHAAALKLDPRSIKSGVDSINAANKAAEPEEQFKPQIKIIDGVKMIQTSKGQWQPYKEPDVAKGIDIGTVEEKMYKGNKVKARWLGSSYGWENIETGEPLYADQLQPKPISPADKLIAAMMGTATATPAAATKADESPLVPPSKEDEDAIKWLAENPTSPKADSVRKRLQSKRVIK